MLAGYFFRKIFSTLSHLLLLIFFFNLLTMIFEDRIVLENRLARLQPLEAPDREPLWLIAQDPSIWTYMAESCNTREAWDAYFDRALAMRDQQLRYPFVIMDLETGKVAGSSSYGNLSIADRRIEIGWTWLAAPFRGTGLNRACKFLLLSFAFEKLDMQRVELKTDVNNRGSRAAIQRLGAQEEGILRSHMSLPSGARRDTVYYSILASEWPKVRQELLKEMSSRTSPKGGGAHWPS